MADNPLAIDWAQAYRCVNRSFSKAAPGSQASRAEWDAKAPSFAHKPQRSDYIAQLMEKMALRPADTVFDMGCGSGTLAVPLAAQGHRVIAVDFSSAMLDELHQVARNQDVQDRIQTFQRSWQESWEGLPQADVAVASRSFITDDLPAALEKLEGQARRRVVLTCGAGDLPYRDRRILKAMGRKNSDAMPAHELSVIAGYLWSKGRLPRIDYIEYPGTWHRATREELERTIGASHSPQNPEEASALAAFLDEHLIYDESRQYWTLDYPRRDCWAVLQWPVDSQEPSA